MLKLILLSETFGNVANVRFFMLLQATSFEF